MIGTAVMTKIPKEWQNLAPVLSVQDVATLLDVHENTVKNWVRDSQLPAFKQGRVIRIHRHDFLKFAGVSEEGQAE